MDKLFPRNEAEKVANLLTGCYVTKTGADKYVIRPRTYEAATQFTQIVFLLTKLGYKEVKTSAPNCAVMKLPKRKLKYCKNRISPAEKLARMIQTGYLTLSQVSTALMNESGWKYALTIQSATADEFKEKQAALRMAVSVLKKYGYTTKMLGGNTLLVSGSTASAKKISVALEEAAA